MLINCEEIIRVRKQKKGVLLLLLLTIPFPEFGAGYGDDTAFSFGVG